MKSSIKLKLKIKGVTVELDKDEIKELKSILDDMFPAPQKEYVYPYWPSYPAWYYREGNKTWTVDSDSTLDSCTITYD